MEKKQLGEVKERGLKWARCTKVGFGGVADPVDDARATSFRSRPKLSFPSISKYTLK